MCGWLVAVTVPINRDVGRVNGGLCHLDGLCPSRIIGLEDRRQLGFAIGPDFGRPLASIRLGNTFPLHLRLLLM